ncbi:recombinase family protein [Pseudomonas sp. Hz4]
MPNRTVAAYAHRRAPSAAGLSGVSASCNPSGATVARPFQLKTALGLRLLLAHSLKATEQPIDTHSAAGKAFLDMLEVFTEFESNLRRERQLEGIAAAKAHSTYHGRTTAVSPRLMTEKFTPQIALPARYLSSKSTC